MTCKDCADKEDCCFYNKEEENHTCWLEICRKWYEAHQENNQKEIMINTEKRRKL